MKIGHAFFVLIAAPLGAMGQLPPPIIDMHLHSLAANAQGPPPLSLCLPATSLGSARSGTTWSADLGAGYAEPACSDPIVSPLTDDALMEATIAIMERRNIIGVTSGPLRNAWQERAGDRVIKHVLH
jgi:hypothetical protein